MFRCSIRVDAHRQLQTQLQELQITSAAAIAMQSGRWCYLFQYPSLTDPNAKSFNRPLSRTSKKCCSITRSFKMPRLLRQRQNKRKPLVSRETSRATRTDSGKLAVRSPTWRRLISTLLRRRRQSKIGYRLPNTNSRT